MIYEDVQRDSGPPDADNGWSSSEFESYEEQSDNETKQPTRSKVVLKRLWMHAWCVYLSRTDNHFHSFLNCIMSGQVVLVGFQHL